MDDEGEQIPAYAHQRRRRERGGRQHRGPTCQRYLTLSTDVVDRRCRLGPEESAATTLRKCTKRCETRQESAFLLHPDKGRRVPLLPKLSHMRSQSMPIFCAVFISLAHDSTSSFSRNPPIASVVLVYQSVCVSPITRALLLIGERARVKPSLSGETIADALLRARLSACADLTGRGTS